jgi:hypothetical protein
MDEKYWQTINFVGNVETAADDARRLLQKIGAWEEFGATGWGESGTESIFQAAAGGAGRQHATDARKKLRSYMTPELQKKIEKFYDDDYNNQVMNLTKIAIF